MLYYLPWHPLIPLTSLAPNSFCDFFSPCILARHVLLGLFLPIFKRSPAMWRLLAMMSLAQQNLKEEKTEETKRNKEQEKKRKPTERSNSKAMIWGQGEHFEMHPTQVKKPPRSYFQSFQRQRNTKHVSSHAILWIVLVETSKCNLSMTLLSLRTYETDYTHLRFGR